MSDTIGLCMVVILAAIAKYIKIIAESLEKKDIK